MLVLTRKANESIIIADNIKIEILEIRGEKVKIGIEAPRELHILRDELHQEVTEQNRQASVVDEENLSKLLSEK
jgi:carbon storage regulator